MAAPKVSEIPEHEYWGFVQKDCKTNEELLPLVNKIIENHQAVLTDAIKNDILSFTSSSDKVKAWSDYWITIINTLGLAYIDPSTNTIYKTSLSQYLYEENSVESFYYYWTLRFQFPFAQSKHVGYKENGIVVQPVISIFESLVSLFEISLIRKENPLDNSYLTIDEIVLVLSKSKSNSIYEVRSNVNTIWKNRERSYDYMDLKVDGYVKSYKNFDGRARLYIEKNNLLEFDKTNKELRIINWEHYFKIKTFLSYRKEAHRLNSNEISRRNFFNSAYNNLNPNPLKLYYNVANIQSDYVGGNPLNIVNQLHQTLNNNGIYFSQEFIESFYLSLKTKPFLILSGISGVGKSLLPAAIMEIVGNRESHLISVSPDWTDNTDMLGYFNISNDFVIGEFTNIVLKASGNLHMPYYVILDEMNLSKVELYFAQVLSNIESRIFNPDINRVEYTNYLFNDATRRRLVKASADHDEKTKSLYIKLSNLKLTNNLFIIGTVNIDESTYPFSKKVLDRANVLEINEVDLSVGLDLMDEEFNHAAHSDMLGIDVNSQEQYEGNDENAVPNEPLELSDPEVLNIEGVPINQESEIDASESDQIIVKELEESPVVEFTTKNIYENYVYLNDNFSGKITNLKELQIDFSLNEYLHIDHNKLLLIWVDKLIEFNKILKPMKMNFGYRLRDEVCIYLSYAAIQNAENLSSDANWWHKYFDQQLVQKVFTRLSGEEGHFEQVLLSLFNLCTTKDFTEEEIIEANVFESKHIIFPRAAHKLQLMLKDLIQFDKTSTSFWSS